jgi:hypothetical protein
MTASAVTGLVIEAMRNRASSRSAGASRSGRCRPNKRGVTIRPRLPTHSAAAGTRSVSTQRCSKAYARCKR